MRAETVDSDRVEGGQEMFLPCVFRSDEHKRELLWPRRSQSLTFSQFSELLRRDLLTWPG